MVVLPLRGRHIRYIWTTTSSFPEFGDLPSILTLNCKKSSLKFKVVAFLRQAAIPDLDLGGGTYARNRRCHYCFGFGAGWFHHGRGPCESFDSPVRTGDDRRRCLGCAHHHVPAESH